MFCLTGRDSVLTCEVFPPFDVSDGQWEIGLVGFTTYNSIPNVEEGVNDKLYYGDKEITKHEGSYEIEDFDKYFLEQIDKKNRGI